MKLEPLKRSSSSIQLRFEYYMKEEVKSAVEWLKNNLCKNRSPPYTRCVENYKECENCRAIKKAFPDLYVK